MKIGLYEPVILLCVELEDEDIFDRLVNDDNLLLPLEQHYIELYNTINIGLNQLNAIYQSN